MKHFLIKRNLTILGAGGGGRPQPPPPPIITLYPAVLTPPLLGDTEQLASFSYAEMIDLISDGPIEGLVNKNGNKLYDENIFEGIYLNDVAIKETSKFNSQAITIVPIKNAIKTLWSDNEEIIKSIPVNGKISQIFNFQDEIKSGVKQFPNAVTIESYHPSISITEFIKQTNADTDLIGTIERAFNSSPVPEEKPFLTVVNIPKMFVYLHATKFNEFEDPKFPIALNIPNIGNHIYFSISSLSLNSFNYFEMPRSFVYNAIKTSAGKKTFLKNKLSDFYSDSSSVFTKYEFLNIKIFLWSIYSTEYGIKKTGSVLDRYLNNINVYQNQPSLYNYNLVQSEFKNGMEFQTPFQNFKNINIEVDYNKELIGPYKLLNTSVSLTDGKVGCGVSRIKNICCSESQNFVDLTNESSDDIRHVRNWPVEYNCEGEPALLTNFNFNYATFDKNSRNRTCQDAVPVTHYITNQNVKEVYLTLNVNALSDTNHIDLVAPGIGTKSLQTDGPYQGAKTYQTLIEPAQENFNQKNTGYLLVVGKNYNDGYVIGGGRSILENVFSNVNKIIERQDLFYRSISLTDGFGVIEPNSDFKNVLWPQYNLTSNSFLYNFTIPNCADPIFTPSFKINDFLFGADLENKLKNLKLDNSLYYCFGLNEKEKLVYQNENDSWTESQDLGSKYYGLQKIPENSSLVLIENSKAKNSTPVFPLATLTPTNNSKFIFNEKESLFIVGYEYFSEKINNLTERHIVGTKINEFINWRAIFNNVLSDGSAVSPSYSYKINLSNYPNIKKYIVDTLWISSPSQFSPLVSSSISPLLGGSQIYWTGTVNGTWNPFGRAILPINYEFKNLPPLFAVGFNKDYFLKREDVWELDPVDNKEYFNISFLENLIEEYVVKNDISANILAVENLEIINFAASKALEELIANYENGKLLANSSVYSINFSYVKNLSNSNFGKEFLDNQNLYNIFNVYLLYPQISQLSNQDNDIIIKYKIYNNKNTLQTNSFKSSFGIAGKGGDARNIKQAISAGTKLPAVVSFEVETGYEKEENINLTSSETYFKYRFDVYGISNGDTLLDIGRKNYTNLKTQKLPSVLGRVDQNLIKFDSLKNIYVYKIFRVKNGILSGTRYFMSDKRTLDNLKANYYASPIQYGNAIQDKSIYNHSVTVSRVGVSNNSPYSYISPTEMLGYGSYIFDTVNTVKSRLSVPSSASFNLSGGVFTIEFWINPISIFAVDTIRLLMIGNDATNSGFVVQFIPNGQMTFGIPNPMALNFKTAINTLEVNKWQHFAFVFDNGSAKLYKNGKLISTQTGRTIPTSNNNALNIGYDTSASYQGQFKGYLTDLRITKTIVYNSEFSVPTSPLDYLSGNAQFLINGTYRGFYDAVTRLNLTDSFGTFFGVTNTKIISGDFDTDFNTRAFEFPHEITQSQFNSFVNQKKLIMGNAIQFLKERKLLKQYQFSNYYEIDSQSVDPLINSLKIDSYRTEYVDVNNQTLPYQTSLNFVQTDIFSYEIGLYETFEINSSFLNENLKTSLLQDDPRFIVYFVYDANWKKSFRDFIERNNIDFLEIEIFRYWEPLQEYNRNLKYWNQLHNLTVYIRQVDSSFTDDSANDVFVSLSNTRYSKKAFTNILDSYILDSTSDLSVKDLSDTVVDYFVLDAEKKRKNLLTFTSTDVNSQYYYPKLDLTFQKDKIIEFLNRSRLPYSNSIADADAIIRAIKNISVTSLVTPVRGVFTYSTFNVYKTNIFTVPLINISEYSKVLDDELFLPISFWTLYNRNTKKISVIFNKFTSSNSYSELLNNSDLEYIELTQFLQGFDHTYKLYVNRSVDKFYSNNQTITAPIAILGNQKSEVFTYGTNAGSFVSWTSGRGAYDIVSYSVDFPDGFIMGNFPRRTLEYGKPTWYYHTNNSDMQLIYTKNYNMYALNFKDNFEGSSSINPNKKIKILSKIKSDSESTLSAALSLLKNRALLGADSLPSNFFTLNSQESPKLNVVWTSKEDPKPVYAPFGGRGSIGSAPFLGYATREGLKSAPLPPEILEISYYEINVTNSISSLLSKYANYSNDLGTQISIPPPKQKENGETVRRYVKVTRLSHETLSPLIQKRISLQKVTEIIPQNFSYPFSAMIGTKIDSRAFSQLPTRTFLCKLKKVLVPTNYFTEDSETGLDVRYIREKIGTKIYEDNWDGSFKLAWTNNPAWILMDLLINKRYGLGNHIESEQIDIWELYKIARWCDAVDENGNFQGVNDGYGGIEPRHTFNGVIEEKYNLFEIVNQVASVFRGNVYYMNSMITFDDDRPKPPAGEFTNSDVKEGIFNYTNMRKDEEFTALDVAFVDERNDYKPSIEYVEDSEAIRKRGILKRNVNAFGITSRGQAKRFGKHILHHTAKEKLNVSFTTDIKALMFKPGDIIQIHDELLSTYKNYGRILQIEDVNENLFKIKIDQAINSGIYNIDEISLHTPISKPKREDILSLYRTKIEKIKLTETSLFNNFIFSHLTGYYNIAPNSSSYITLTNSYGITRYVTGGIDFVTLNAIINSNKIFTSGIGIENLGLGSYLEIPNFYLGRDENFSDEFPTYTGKLEFNFKSIKYNPNPSFLNIAFRGNAAYYEEYIIKTGINVNFAYKNGKSSLKTNLDGFWEMTFPESFISGYLKFDSKNTTSRTLYGKYFFQDFDYIISEQIVEEQVYYKEYNLPQPSNVGKVNFDPETFKNTIINYSDIIESDRPTVETFSIFSYETGSYQVTGNLIGQSGEIPTEYTEIILNKTGSEQQKKESVLYNLDSIPVGSTYSLNLIGKEKFIFKITSINENYINEYNIMATQYSESKFFEIEEPIQYDKIENTFNQLYYYTRSSTSYDQERSLQSPIINNIYRFNKQDGNGFGLAIEWQMQHYLLSNIKYKIYIKTPSKQTRNIEISSDYSAYNSSTNLFTLYWNGNQNGYNELGTYTVYIMATLQDGELNKFSAENSRSITILDY